VHWSTDHPRRIRPVENCHLPSDARAPRKQSIRVMRSSLEMRLHNIVLQLSSYFVDLGRRAGRIQVHFNRVMVDGSPPCQDQERNVRSHPMCLVYRMEVPKRANRDRAGRLSVPMGASYVSSANRSVMRGNHQICARGMITSTGVNRSWFSVSPKLCRPSRASTT
jgi:hypothetical protein